MSDIGLPGLDRVVDIIFGLCVVVPPLLMGLLLLLIGRFIRNRRMILTVLYFVLSIGVSFTLLWWLSDWLNDPDVLWWALSLSVIGPVSMYGLFGFFRWIWRRLFTKRLAKKSLME